MSRSLSSMPVGDSRISHLGDLKSLDELCSTGAAVLLSVVVSLSGRCQKFFPVFEEVAALLSETGSQIRCAQIEATGSRIGSRFAVRYYPAVILYRGPQDFKTYRGPLRKDEIGAYLGRQEMPTVTHIDSPAQLQDLRRTHNTVVVAFLDLNDWVSRQSFVALADDMKDDFVFCTSNHPSIAAQEDASVPSVILYKNVAETKSVFRHPWSTEAVRDFIKAAAQPLIMELLPELHEKILQTSLPLGYIFVSSHAQQQQANVDFLSIARKYHDRFQIHAVNVDGFPQLVGKMHVEPGQWPAFAIHEQSRNHKYPLNCRDNPDRPLEPEEVDRFIESFLAGKLRPTIKSQAIPSVQVGAVVEVVGLTFEDVVVNSDKDVLVEYYTQWCGPCKALLPEYERLASLYASDNKARDLVTIVKVDYENNDVPDMDVRGFPWFKLYPAGSKGLSVFYDGERRVSAWASFIAEKGTHKVILH